MGLAAQRSLVFFALFSFVQCPWVQFVDNDIDLRNVSAEGLTTINSGWSSYDGDWHFGSATPFSRTKTDNQSLLLPYSKSSQNGRRTRRQAYYTKNSYTAGGPFSWSHYFTIPPVYSNTKESAYVREENMKRLKNTLEKDTVFQFLSPSGLRISIPADNINVRIVDFRFKLNEEFRGNDGGHYAPTSYKRGSLSTYDIPQLRVKQGDKVYYWLSVRFNKEGTDVVVKGVLEITLGNPHAGGSFTEPIPFRPTTSSVLSPQQNFYGGGLTPTLGGGLGGGTRGSFVWNHQFTINATYSNRFTQSSGESWLQQAELLKNSVQNIDFQFSNPSGLTVMIPDNNANIRIEDFRLKLNEEFLANDGGHYAPNSYKRGGFWTYNIPQLKAKQGDKIYYWMRVKLGKEAFDTIVRGVLDIPQGNPHQGSNPVQMTPTFPRPQTAIPPQVSPQRPQTLDGGLGGGRWGQQAVRWEHRFTINTTYNAGFNQESANRWFDEAQLFKNTLEKDIEFQFLNPTGLSISISGDNEDVKILAFNIKLNEEFRTLGPGHYVANITRMRDGRWSYYYPNLKLRQGDKVYYWMRVTLGKQAFDNIVKGVLEVTQGDPHIGGPVPTLPAPTHLTPVAPPPSTPNKNQYPTQSFPNRYPSPPSSFPPKPPSLPPSQPTSNQYPTKPDPSQYPSQPDTNQYPSQPNSNQYPPQSPPNRYPTKPPSSQYPSQPDPNQYPTQPDPNQYPLQPDINQYPAQPDPNQYPTQPDPNQYPTQPDPNQYPAQPDPNQYPAQPDPNQYPSQPNQPCETSQSSSNGGTTTPCQGEVLFEHKFNSMDGWTHQISIGGKNPGYAITLKFYLQW